MGSDTTVGELIAQGAQILDVRSRGEFAAGHLKGSVNMPVDQLSVLMKKLKDKNRPVITCCASGMRSAHAKRLLESAGFTNVHNGGSWQSLRKYVS